MIKRRVGQMAITNRLKKLEAMQENKEHIGVIAFSVRDDGRIWMGDIKGKTIFFETMFEAENYLISVPGVTEKTTIILDDMSIADNWLYLPSIPILYFCNSEQRRNFADVILDSEKWFGFWREGYLQTRCLHKQRTPDCS